jgi:hypothetical protein
MMWDGWLERSQPNTSAGSDPAEAGCDLLSKEEEGALNVP